MEELIPITLFMSIAAVAILRPISTKLGGLLEAMKNEKVAPVRSADDPDLARMRVLMEHISKRVDLMEERMDFTERLLNGRRSGRDDAVLKAREHDFRGREADLLRARGTEPLRP
jgi:hypothetical protein